MFSIENSLNSAAIRSAKIIGKTSIPVLVEIVSHKDDDAAAGRTAAYILLKMYSKRISLRCKVQCYLVLCYDMPKLAIRLDEHAIPLLAEAVKNVNTRGAAFWILEEYGHNALPEIMELLGNSDEHIRHKALLSAYRILEQMNTMKALRQLESQLMKAPIDKIRSSPLAYKLAQLMAKLAEKKNQLAPQRDILLDDIPKPPKKGGTYQQIRRTVGNG
jgi:hypothetical protein